MVELPLDATDDDITWAATLYPHLGWRVFPLHGVDMHARCSCGRADCSSPGKHPATHNGCLDATLDEATIRGWFSPPPDPRRAPRLRNIGLATGRGLFVLDVDPRHGGERSLATLELPHTVTVRTGSGGLHLYFAVDPDPAKPTRNSARGAAHPDLPGIDGRGDGGYVVAPPSAHASGRPYEWLIERSAWGRDPAPLPECLYPIAYGAGSMVGATQPVSLLPATALHRWVTAGPASGERNLVATRFAGYLFRKDVDALVVARLVRLWNEHVLADPLPAAELDTILDSVAGRELRRRLRRPASGGGEPSLSRP